MAADPGPCRPQDPTQFFKRFYFNRTTATCQLFFYGGCGGNHNNFERKSDCLTFCGESTSQEDQNHPEPFDPEHCLKSPKHGSCQLSEERWFFSHWDNLCKPYNYSGCGANMNTFLTEAECQAKCPQLDFTQGESRCDRLRRRGDCQVKMERYFYDKFEKKCVRFGACDDMQETENNFQSRAECTNICTGKKSGG